MKGSEARPTSCTFHRCLDPGTFRSNIDSKKYLSWRSPQVPKAPKCGIRKCLRNYLGVSGQTSPYLSFTSKHAKVHKASLKTTFTPLNNTNPSPTLHTHQYHSLPSHNPPSSSTPHQQYNPPSTHQNVTLSPTPTIPLLPPRRTLRPHHPGPPHPGPRGTKPNQPKIPPTV